MDIKKNTVNKLYDYAKTNKKSNMLYLNYL